jgi:hypothetical protein
MMDISVPEYLLKNDKSIYYFLFAIEWISGP